MNAASVMIAQKGFNEEVIVNLERKLLGLTDTGEYFHLMCGRTGSNLRDQ